MRSLIQKLITKVSSGRVVQACHCRDEITKTLFLLAQNRIREFYISNFDSLHDAEFRIFSQWGEDGIIQYLISKIPITNRTFIEFGVANYEESNTRFLLMNDNWRGLIIDSDPHNITHIQKSDIYWRYNLTAIQAFITNDNIGELIKGAGFHSDIGLLSIDLDGNDYWIWKAITSEIISPRIVIVEYNSIFGPNKAITVPYFSHFIREKMHYSTLYAGASIKALWLLGQQKGYVLVGSNSSGNNAFFVRADIVKGLPNLLPEKAYVESQFRESRDENGSLTYASGSNRLGIIKDQVVCDIEKNEVVKLNDIYSL